MTVRVGVTSEQNDKKECLNNNIKYNKFEVRLRNLFEVKNL